LTGSLEGILKVGVLILTFFDSFVVVTLADGLYVTLFEVILHLLATGLVWSNEGLILPKSATTKGAIENLNRLQGHARPDLDQHKLFNIILLREHLLMLVKDLISAEPDLVILELEAKHVIDERLALRVVFRRVEHLTNKFFLYAQSGRAVEALVEGEQWSAVLEAVAAKLELVSRADVRNKELG